MITDVITQRGKIKWIEWFLESRPAKTSHLYTVKTENITQNCISGIIILQIGQFSRYLISRGNTIKGIHMQIGINIKKRIICIGNSYTEGVTKCQRTGAVYKFKSYRKRMEVVKNRRKLKGTKYVIVEDLTAKNQKLLNEARVHSKVETAWSKDGHIIVLLKGSAKSTKLIRSCDELKML